MDDSDQTNQDVENPYEAPKTEAAESLRVAAAPANSNRATGRVVVIVLSLLFIPPTVFIAFFVTCLGVSGASSSIEAGVLSGLFVGLLLLVLLVLMARELAGKGN